MKTASTASTRSKTPSKKGPTKAQLAAAAAIGLTPSEPEKPAPENQEPVVTEQPAPEITETNAEAPVEATPAKPDAMSFAVQQLTTPVALTDEQKAEMKAELERIAQKYGVAVAPVIARVPRDKVVANGITRPGADTLCGQVFAAADAISAKSGSFATIGQLKKEPNLANMNDHTLKTQYARWRQFNGITGRLVAPVAVAAPAPATPAAQTPTNDASNPTA